MLSKVWLFLGWLWIAIIFYLSLMPHPPEPISFSGVDKVEHALAYVLLMLWFSQIYLGLGIRIRLIAAFIAMGVLIEILQGMTGYRYFEYADMLADACGVMIGFGLAYTRMGCVLTLLENKWKTLNV